MSEEEKDDNIEMVGAPEPVQDPTQGDSEFPKTIMVGDGFEIRTIKYLVAAINEKGWLILQPYQEKKSGEGMSDMMKRLSAGIVRIRKSK